LLLILNQSTSLREAATRIAPGGVGESLKAGYALLTHPAPLIPSWKSNNESLRPSPADLGMITIRFQQWPELWSGELSLQLRVDYRREGINEAFRFDNPNVKATCGCGESFAA
jgi:hypothetical protein